MANGFEVCEEVVAVPGGWEARVCAWAPTRAAWEADPGANRRHVLVGGTAADPAFARDAMATLADMMWKYLVARYGSGGRRVPGPAVPPGEAAV